MVSALRCSIVHIHVFEIAPDRISLFFFLIIVYLDSSDRICSGLSPFFSFNLRRCVSLGIIDRDLNFQVAVIDAPESLGHFGGIRYGIAARVKPISITKAVDWTTRMSPSHFPLEQPSQVS